MTIRACSLSTFVVAELDSTVMITTFSLPFLFFIFQEKFCFPDIMAWIIFPGLPFLGAALLLQVCYLGLLISGTQASIEGLVNLTKVSVAEVAEELVKM